MSNSSRMRETEERISSGCENELQSALSRTVPQSQLSHSGRVLGFDFVQHPYFAWLTIGILVYAQILLGHLVDVFVGALLGNLLYFAANFNIAIRIIGVHDSQRHIRIAPHITIFLPASCGIENHMLAVIVHPHWCHLRPPVRHDCTEAGECLLFKQVLIFLGNSLRHETSLHFEAGITKRFNAKIQRFKLSSSLLARMQASLSNLPNRVQNRPIHPLHYRHWAISHLWLRRFTAADLLYFRLDL